MYTVQMVSITHYSQGCILVVAPSVGTLGGTYLPAYIQQCWLGYGEEVLPLKTEVQIILVLYVLNCDCVLQLEWEKKNLKKLLLKCIWLETHMALC